MKNILWIIKHQLYDLLSLIGMRDRLRCPICRSVGTWKPHGGWCDDSQASGRRWLCKWCGHYVGIPQFGVHDNFKELKGTLIMKQAFIDPVHKCWRLGIYYSHCYPHPENSYVPKDKVKANPFIG